MFGSEESRVVATCMYLCFDSSFGGLFQGGVGLNLCEGAICCDWGLGLVCGGKLGLLCSLLWHLCRR